jgi:hypothetical protein
MLQTHIAKRQVHEQLKRAIGNSLARAQHSGTAVTIPAPYADHRHKRFHQ